MQEQRQLIPQNQYNFLATLIESRKLPAHVKTVEDAFTISQMGKELGFATMQAFHYIIPIQGKLSLSMKAIGALLRKGGVRFTTMEDGVYVYADGTTSEYPRDNPKPIDRRTTITFERDNQVEKTSFTWMDAVKQELAGKDNWKRMPKEMLWARCLSKGSNRIAADLLLGLYSAEEMFDVFGSKTNVKRDEEGHIVEVVDAEAEVLAN